MSNGFAKTFNNASTMANTRAVQKSSTCTPASIFERIKETAAMTSILMMNCMGEKALFVVR
jgi:hypothetical protein